MKTRTLQSFLLVLLLLAPMGLLAWWLIGMSRIFHDKAINADALQRLWSYGRSVPLQTVVPAHNRWTAHAFVAEASDEEPGRHTSVLILDDHYRGNDPTYRSQSGVVGNDL